MSLVTLLKGIHVYLSHIVTIIFCLQILVLASLKKKENLKTFMKHSESKILNLYNYPPPPTHYSSLTTRAIEFFKEFNLVFKNTFLCFYSFFLIYIIFNYEYNNK